MAESTEPELVGTSSDHVPAIGAEGCGDITTLFVSMAERHPTGADADYLRWHTLDHRPEQHRLSGVRASLRLVSTPACRSARAASLGAFDAIDHVMTYFFTDVSGLERFNRLSRALNGAGRVPFVLEPVQRGVYGVTAKRSAPRVKVGADVLPWWPVKGAYLLLEPGSAPAVDLVSVAGVAGAWSANAVMSPLATAETGQRLTLCFLDEDPVVVAGRLKPMLEHHWKVSGIQARLAAPFHPIVPYEWERYLP
jgi:hypothetical protein